MFFEINNLNEHIKPSGNSTAIVTLAIGDFHQRSWNQLFKNSWMHYASKYNFDVFFITIPLDSSEKGLSTVLTWQKCLILEQQWTNLYERIIWIDADILISPRAPNIISSVQKMDTVGISYEQAQLSEVDRDILFELQHGKDISPQSREKIWNEYYRDNLKGIGFRDDMISVLNNEIFNTGVMVLSPAHHRDIFRLAYNERRSNWGQEQPILSYILKLTQKYTIISPRFNWLLYPVINLHLSFCDQRSNYADEILPAFVKSELNKSYFLHFNGCRGLAQFLMDKKLNIEEFEI